MPYGGVDTARITNLAGLDEVTANSRMGALLYPVTIQGVTFPVSQYGINVLTPRGTPFSISTATGFTLLFPNMLTGFAVVKSTAAGAAITVTLDTAANMVQGFNAVSAGAQVGDILPFVISNTTTTASNTLTIATGAGGGFDANLVNTSIAISTSKTFYIRLTNVTAGSEAYVAYF